ncbi:GNAT family N-acetyltransferase [Neobacillus sp. PS3-12]|uniref:GNAT family N-acetyltransferase n=1 Tax=Neobacillus sp. PS3-12 TaxID=3070677 RepID=UPI0027E14D7C|nr:GNAT family N-acetyltransferase [Neobacillus sp. PS3-12]WML52482.1 GNAT family N-acetyltransferase [Neobacillus sp. PS3-12]
MSDIELVDGGIHELKDVYQQYINDFAIDELKKYEQLEFLLSRNNYKLLLAKDITINEIVGYAFIYELKKFNAIWLDYIAVIKKYRNQGYGTVFLNKILHYNEDGLGVFIEVEIPEESYNKKNQLRRIKFYERLGAKKLHLSYLFPTYNGGFPMFLYFRPSSNIRKLPKKLIQEAIAEVFENIHTDVKNREHILIKFFSTIEDEDFV